MTLLTRHGNKSKIAKQIQNYFPIHKQYIELFFGAGGMFFNKPKAKFNIVNDNDSDVYNLFDVALNHKEKLIDLFRQTPIHENLWNYWRENRESDPIRGALRFLILSNFGYLGGLNLAYKQTNTSELILKHLDETQKHLFGVVFMNCDFREVLPKISFRTEREKEKAFVYADPPYLGTKGKYQTNFSKNDTLDLFDTLEKSGIRFAVSEFDNPFVLDEAKRRNLNIIDIGERVNLKNRRNEILITNYEHSKSMFYES